MAVSTTEVLPLEMLFLYMREEAKVTIVLKDKAWMLEGKVIGMDEFMNLTLKEARRVSACGEIDVLGEILLKGDGILTISSALQAS